MSEETPKTVVVQVKPKLASKTLWLNGIATVVLGIAAWMGALPELAPYAAIVLSIGNFLLRFATSAPVAGGAGS